jgi:hypothetical protein
MRADPRSDGHPRPRWAVHRRCQLGADHDRGEPLRQAQGPPYGLVLAVLIPSRPIEATAPPSSGTAAATGSRHRHARHGRKPWTRLMMMGEKAISVIVGILVVARAVNILRYHRPPRWNHPRMGDDAPRRFLQTWHKGPARLLCKTRRCLTAPTPMTASELASSVPLAVANSPRRVTRIRRYGRRRREGGS